MAAFGRFLPLVKGWNPPKAAIPKRRARLDYQNDV